MISILMPVKNAGLFLKECLDSCIAQSYTNWELIAVNDFSTDDSKSILLHYAKMDKRIKVFDNSNMGLIHALRLAYALSQGDYITRMDADDVNDSLKFETMLDQLKSFGKGYIALGLVRYFSEQGVADGFKKYESWLNSLNTTGIGFSQIYKECPVPSPCWLLHREDLDSCGAFDADLYPEDYDLCFRWYEQGLKCIPTNKVLLHWRDHNLRTSRNDKNYTEQKMLALKCHYFLRIDRQSTKQLVLWGAGKRAKFIAKQFIEKNVSFRWVCNNPRKIGKEIYGVILEDYVHLSKSASNQVIITVSNEEEQKEVLDFCEEGELTAYLFC